MIKRALITAILTAILIAVPYWILTNFKRSSERAEELTIEFTKIETAEIDRVKMTIWSNYDSLLFDSTIVDKAFCQKLRQELLIARDKPGPTSRLISSERITLTLHTTADEHVNIDLYITDITALFLIKTKNQDYVTGLDDLYRSIALKEFFEGMKTLPIDL